MTVFAQPGGMSNNTDLNTSYSNQAMSQVGVGSNNNVFYLRVQANATTSSGTKFYQFNSDGYFNVWNLNTPSYNTVSTAVWGTGGYNSGIKMGATTNGNYYTFNLRRGTSYANQSMAILETSFNPRDISSYSVTQNNNGTATVSVTMSGALNSGEFLYVAYSTDGFASAANSGIVQISSLNGSNIGTATIPAFLGTVTYYPFTSVSNSLAGASNSTNFANAPILTLTMRSSTGLNNTGAYSTYYTDAPKFFTSGHFNPPNSWIEGNASAMSLLTGFSNTTYSRQVSGINTGTSYFKFFSNTSGGTYYGPAAATNADSLVPLNTKFNLATNGRAQDKSYGFTGATNTDVYMIKTAGVNGGTAQAVVFRIGASGSTVQTISNNLTATTACSGSAVTITATLSGAFPVGQAAYLRYSTSSAMTSSTVVQMTGSGTTYTATIPAGINTAGATIHYYAFTSGSSGPASDGSDADLYAFNYNFSSGTTPYNYTVSSTPLPPTASNNGPVCTGGTLSLSASTIASATYSWSGPSSYGSISQNPTVSSSATSSMAGTYSVTATVAGCTSSAATTTVTVNTAVNIGTQPADQTVCSGANATFSVSATGTGLTYQWRKNGVNISDGATGNGSTYSGTGLATLTITGALAADAVAAGSGFDCVVSGTSPCTSVTSSRVALTISSGVSISGQPTAQTACSNPGTASFSVTASGASISYRWRLNGVNLSDGAQGNGSTVSGATSATLNLSNLSTSNTVASGSGYDCVVSSSCGTPVTSSRVALTVSSAVSISTQPTAQTACTNPGTATFTIAATGDGLTYRWRLNGVNLSDGAQANGSTVSGATNATLNLSNLSTSNAVASGAGYDCVVSGTSPCSSVTSSRVALTVNTLSAFTVNPSNTSACSGSTAGFSVTATNATSFQWQVSTNNGQDWNNVTTGTGGATSSYTTEAVTTGMNNYQYRCVASGTSPCASVNSSAATLTVNSASSVSSSPSNTTVCSGASASFTVSATGSPTFAWRRRDGGWNTGGTANAWSYTVGSNGGFFIGSSSTNGNNTGGGIDVGGKAWGLYNAGTTTTQAQRDFAPMTVGQVFQVDMDNGWLNTGAIVGFSLRNSSGDNMVELYFKEGQASYLINRSGGEQSTGLGYTAGGVRFTLTVTSSTTYSATVQGLNGGSTLGPFTGTFISSGSISRFRAFSFNNTNGANFDLYFNNLKIGPSVTAPLYEDDASGYATQGSNAGWLHSANNNNNGGSSPINAASPFTGVAGSTLTINPATSSQAGSYDVVVYNSCGGATSSAATLTINAVPSISTTTLPSGTTGILYSQTVSASGGTTPYTWSVTSGTLPAGLTLNSSTGAIAGTPTGSGTSTFTVQVASASTPSCTASQSLSITVAGTPSITSVTSSLPTSSTTQTYKGATITVSGNNLGSVTSVRLGGSGGTVITGATIGASTITFTVPDASSGGTVYVLNPDGNATSTESFTNLGNISTATGNWSSTSTWLGGAVPASATLVTIANGHNVTLNQAATISGLTINSGATFTSCDASTRTLTITRSASATTLTNNGTWSNGSSGGTSTVVFTGAPSSGDATHTTSGTIGFQNVTVNKTSGSSNVGITFGANATLTGTLEIGSGGFVASSYPASFFSGLLASVKFNTGGTYDVNTNDNTWPSTGSLPPSIEIASGTVNLNAARTTAENLTISGGTLALTAQLTVQGNWSRTSGTFTPGTQTVVFSGADNATLSGASGASFYNLEINKSAGSTITLNSALKVTNTLTMTSGIVISTASNILNVTRTAAAAVSVSGTSAYVSGPMTRNLQASQSGSSTFTFPVGKHTGSNTGYYGISLVNPVTGSAGEITVTAEAFNTGSGGSAGSGIYSISSDEYWRVQVSSGTGGSLTSSTYSLQRPSAVSPFSVIGRATSASGAYVTIGGTASSNAINNSSSASGAADQFFALGTVPSVTVTGSLSAFANTCTNASSSEQSFTVSGAYLLGNISITPPAGFEISTGTGGSFVATNPITLTPSSGTVNSTTIYVRFSPSAAGSASGNISATSTSATQRDIAVSGTGSVPPAITAQPSTSSQSRCIGDGPTALSVTASGTTPTYAWYSNTANSNSGGTLISGATSASYTPSTASAGTLYYYVVVTGSGGCTSTSVTSNVSGAVSVSGLSNDKASNYGSTWSSGTSLGGGFGNWSLLASGGGSGGHFIGNSDIGSSAWGMFANGGRLVQAIRPFSSALSIGNTLSLAMDNGFIATSSVVGFRVRNSSNNILMEFRFVGGANPGDYTVTDGTGSNFSTGISYTSSGLSNITFAYSAAGKYILSITKSGETTVLAERNLSNPTGGQIPAQIELFNNNSRNNDACGSPNPACSSWDAFFNNLSIGSPVITSHPSTSAQTVCEGVATTQLSVTAYGSNLSYQWYRNTTNSNSGGTLISGANDATYTPPSVSAGTNYYYCVVGVTGAGSCVSSVTSKVSGLITVNESQPASVSIASSDADNAICSGTSVTFTATPTNGGASPSYQWKLNGGNVGSNSNIATYTNASLANGDVVSVVLTSNATCATGSPATSNSITTTVNANPTVQGINNESRCGTGTVVIGATASAGATIDWYASSSGGGSALTGGTGVTSFTTPSISTTTIYHAQARNTTTGCISTSRTAVTATVNSVPTQPTIGTITQPTCLVSSSVALSGLPSSGSWTVTESLTSSTITGTGTTGAFNNLPDGTYTFTVTNSDNCTSVASASATINPAAGAPNEPADPASQSVCSNSSQSFTFTNMVAGSGGDQIQWATNSGFTGSTTVSSPATITTASVASGSSATIYFRTRNSSTGCVSGAVQSIVTVNPVPAAPTIGTITQPTCTTNTGSVALSGLPAGNWTITGSPSGSATGEGSTTTISGLTAGTTYTFTVNNGTCTSTSSNNAVVNAALTVPTSVSVSGGGTACGSKTITASGGTNGTIYFQGTTSGGTSVATASSSQTISTAGTNTYYFRSRSADGCWGTEGSAVVTINALPSVAAIGGGAATVCAGAETPEFTNATSGGTWSIVNGTGTATISGGGVVTGGSAGTVTVRYTIDDGTCTNHVSTSLTVLPVHTLTISSGTASQTVVVNNAITSVGFTIGGGATGLSITSGSLPAGVSFSGGVISGTPTATGTFSVTVTTSGNSCTTDNEVITINVNSSSPAPGTKFWTGGSGNWSEAANWNPTGKPSSSDNVYIDNGSPVMNENFILSSGRTFTLTGTGSLTINPGVTFTITGNADFGGLPVRLKSDANGTASIGQIANNGSALTGASEVTVERYLQGRRRWRALTAPVTGTSNNTIFEHWQNSGASGLGNSTGAIMWKPGGGGGFYSGGVSTSILSFNNGVSSSWSALTNTDGTALFGASNTAPKTFMLFFTGPYNNTGQYVTSGTAASTLSATGALRQGSVTISVAPGWNMIGNPYASSVQLNSGTGLSSFAYEWDAGMARVGGYKLIPSLSSKVIQSSQAIFVYGESSEAAITFNEGSKVSSSSVSVFRMDESAVKGDVYVKLNKYEGANTEVYDEAIVNYKEREEYRLPKLPQLYENLSIYQNSKDYGMASRVMKNGEDVIQLRLWQMNEAAYQLNIDLSSMKLPVGSTAVLQDAFLNKETSLSITESNKIDFSVNSNTASSGQRFRILLRRASVPVTSVENPSYQIYPNPVQKGSIMQLEFRNQKAGKYEVVIYSMTGVRVQKAVIGHNGGTTVQSINLDQRLSAGSYLVEVVTENGTKKQLKLTVQ